MSVISKLRSRFACAASYFQGIEGEQRFQGIVIGSLIAIAIGFAFVDAPQPAQDFNAASTPHTQSLKLPHQKAVAPPVKTR